MSWNVDELKSLLNCIKSLPSTPAACSDIDCLNYMISCLDHDWKYEHSSVNNLEQRERVMDFVNKNYDILKSILLGFCDIKVMPKNWFVKQLKPSEFERNVKFLLEEYDRDMSAEYRDLKNKSRLLFANQKFPNTTASGITFPICTIGSCYVGVIHSNNVRQSSTLIHEIGHVYQLEGMTDHDYVSKVLNSVWGETFPLFLEKAYADFLKRVGYRKLGLQLEYHLLDSFLANVDCFYELYFHRNKADDYEISRLFSGFLSSYFLNEYRRNPDKAKEMVDSFNSMIGRKDDIEILESFDSMEVFNAPKTLINDYYRTR